MSASLLPEFLQDQLEIWGGRAAIETSDSSDRASAWLPGERDFRGRIGSPAPWRRRQPSENASSLGSGAMSAGNPLHGQGRGASPAPDSGAESGANLCVETEGIGMTEGSGGPGNPIRRAPVTMDDSWRRWCAENVLLGQSEASMVQAMLDAGVDRDTAIAE